jgi:hypothetical protein
MGTKSRIAQYGTPVSSYRTRKIAYAEQMLICGDVAGL